MQQVTNPDAREIFILRNHLEHKYVKVYGDIFPSRHTKDPFYDSLAYSISRTHLERRALRLLQLTRSAVIYLSLGMHREEKTRLAKQSGLALPMHLSPYQYDLKR